ncbi:Hypothetical predicted protein [Olea europaea subsp. europaea]|uniref:Flotillin-like n=1 Tax=Olea europaea subsp. europaea TaxID=158383 RepID=A0A8S0UMK0_OLEEU|nr:Hypothetical predicted protein [Olea europaea subsp. europaea]
MEAANQAKFDVTEVEMKGETGPISKLGSLQETEAEEACPYQKEKEAQAQKAEANATFYRQQVVDGELYAKKKEAEGLIAKTQDSSQCNGRQLCCLRDCLMISGGMFQGLQPNISIWTNGGGEAADGTRGVNSAMKELAGVYRMSPPLFMTVNEQNGMLPPAWMGTLDQLRSPYQGLI